MKYLSLIAHAVARFAMRETVLLISLVAAISSAAFVPPDRGYLDYLDWKVLSSLFCLMAVVAGFRKQGVFEIVGLSLIRLTGSLRALALALVFATFAASMFVTNDVALITFVPFSLALLGPVASASSRATIIVLQTIAANVGSSLTPVGNPQNLYLFSFYEMSPVDFFCAIGPIVAAGAVFLALALLAVPARVGLTAPSTGYAGKPNRRLVAVLAALFVLSVLAVFRVVDWRIALAAVVVFLALFARDLFARVDYSLLLTFVAFFVFIGNLQRIDSVRSLLTGLVAKDVVLVGVLASQVISNVPAAILLSPFTTDAAGLLVGVSVGGMGTIIASLASVISFKFFARECPEETRRYLGIFTAWNLAFLVVLYAEHLVVRALA